jgi:hypothetical protein
MTPTPKKPKSGGTTASAQNRPKYRGPTPPPRVRTRRATPTEAFRLRTVLDRLVRGWVIAEVARRVSAEIAVTKNSTQPSEQKVVSR